MSTADQLCIVKLPSQRVRVREYFRTSLMGLFFLRSRKTILEEETHFVVVTRCSSATSAVDAPAAADHLSNSTSNLSRTTAPREGEAESPNITTMREEGRGKRKREVGRGKRE